ncbi:hypothetical protein BFS86_19645 [Shewanella algae]|nr:hypothetical protein BFS86_19645 [Shewanella algae]
MSRHLNLGYTDWDAFDRSIADAQQKKTIAVVIEESDNFLHTIFESGSEPKWAHPSQRESLLKLRCALIPLGESIGVLNAEGVRLMDEVMAADKARKAK